MSDDKCPKVATFSYLWPGNSGVSYCCSIHMAQISAVGLAMGCPIGFSLIGLEDGQMCANTLSKEDKKTFGIKT